MTIILTFRRYPAELLDSTDLYRNSAYKEKLFISILELTNCIFLSLYGRQTNVPILSSSPYKGNENRTWQKIFDLKFYLYFEILIISGSVFKNSSCLVFQLMKKFLVKNFSIPIFSPYLGSLRDLSPISSQRSPACFCRVYKFKSTKLKRLFIQRQPHYYVTPCHVTCCPFFLRLKMFNI